MTSGSDGTITYPLGWCFTCDTNTCDHVLRTNKRLIDSLIDYQRERLAAQIKLPGLTGEPWSKDIRF